MSRSRRVVRKRSRFWLNWEPAWYRRDRYRRFVRQRSRQLLREGKTDLMPKPYRDQTGWYW